MILAREIPNIIVKAEMAAPELIWYQDPIGFFSPPHLTRIVPLGSQSYAEQLNSVLRLSLYYGVIMFAVRGDWMMLGIPLGVASLTYLMYASFRSERNCPASLRENMSEEGCVRPTKHNPFMNVLVSDKPERMPACDALNDKVRSEMDATFQQSMFYDIDDVWARNNASRSFYTTPSTSTPNDQTALAEWLYGGVRAGGKQTRPPRNAPF